MNCPNCSKPFIEGDNVRAVLTAIFHKAVSPLYALEPVESIQVIHEDCVND